MELTMTKRWDFLRYFLWISDHLVKHLLSHLSRQTVFHRIVNVGGALMLAMSAAAATSSDAPDAEVASPPTPVAVSPRSKALWRNDFDQDPVGPYTTQRLDAGWPGRQWDIGLRNCFIEETDRGRSLRVSLPKGSDLGAKWLMPLPGVYEEIYYAFWFKLSNNFNPDETIGGDRGKFPGICGGGCNTGGEQADGYNGWSNRVHFGDAGEWWDYSYVADHSGPWGKRYDWREGSRPQPGRWHHLEVHVRLNTPGEKNGLLETWLDGKLVDRQTSVLFRRTKKLKIDRFIFNFFTNSPSKRSQSLLFDDFIVAPSRISSRDKPILLLPHTPATPELIAVPSRTRDNTLDE